MGKCFEQRKRFDAVPVPVGYVTSHPIKTCLDESKPETCTESFAIDTLMPAGGNWGLIRSYVQEILNGD